jgi:DNA-binding NarL/FixJ family response regulator
MRQAHKLPILIVADHLLVREGLKRVLSDEFRDLVFSEAKTAADAVAQIQARPWRLVILDINLPDHDGFFVLREIRTRRPEAAVLMLSMQSDSKYAARSLQLGAAGFISKSSGRSSLLNAVKSVLEGKTYFGKSIRHEVGDTRSFAPHVNLSAQECEVLLALAAGGRTGSIAAELNLSAKTVSTYKRRVLNKLGLTSTAGLVHYVIDHNLA